MDSWYLDVSNENPSFPEMGIADKIRRQYNHDSLRSVFSTNADIVHTISPSMVNSNAMFGDKETSSKTAASIMDSSSRDSSLIDLKLGGFGVDNTNSHSESSTPAKRIRAMSLSSHTSYCQVFGCNKDLSTAKDYHKRHKVCDVHSKTAKVVVNGIEQRFCQQCSRFHVIAEFDDGKRSCRKRLAGHNERRRKPPVGFNTIRNGRSFHSYTGSVGCKFDGNTLAATSFICQDILGPSQTESYATNSWNKRIKIEDGEDPTQKSTNTCIFGEIQHKTALFQYPPVMDHINNTGPVSVFSENINQYPHGMVSRSLLQTNSLGSEDLSLFDAASTVQGITEISVSESGCALSLLSSQSQNSPSRSPGIPTTSNPLIIPSGSPHYSVSEISEKLFGVCSQGLTSGVDSRYPSYKASSTGRNHLNMMPVLDNGDTVNSDFANGILHGSGFLNL